MTLSRRSYAHGSSATPLISDTIGEEEFARRLQPLAPAIPP